MNSILPPGFHPGNPPTLRASLALAYWALVALATVPSGLHAAATVVGPETGGHGPEVGLVALLPNLVAVAAIAVGVLRNAPSRRWPWALVALAIGVWSAGDQVYADLVAGPATIGDELDTATLLGMLYLVGFIGLAAALLRLRRSDGNGLAPAGLLDTLTVTLVLVLLIWVSVVSPGGPGPSSLLDPTIVAYLIGDALIVATAVRLTLVGPATPAVLALVAAAAAVLVSDLAHSLAAAGVSGSLSLVESIGAGAAAGSLGWAALHPSMARLTETEPAPTGPLSLRRFWVAALAAMVAPFVLLVQAIAGRVRDGVVLAVLGAALTLVAMARVAATGRSQSRFLEFRAGTDTLTGLASRAHLIGRLHGPGEPAWSAVLLVDLDQFRQLNHDEGPSVGDEVLVALAGRLRRLAGPDDLVARVGGDEFAILVGGIARDLTALTIDVVAATTEPVLVGRRAVPTSACVGVAVPPEDLPKPSDPVAAGEELLRRAGLALRAAKAAGPGEWCRYDSDRHGLLLERMRMRESLHRAVDESAFDLSYQPIVALATGKTVGFEALIRWVHPTRGPIAPSEFIDVAEETGLIDAIGDLVLRSAVAEAVGWPDQAGGAGSDVYVSVNVSPRQLRHPGLAERVEEVLTGSGLPPQRLMLELTESVVTKSTDHVWAELALLRDMGVRLALDDFGTGFSSLSYLEQTPIGVIKMDKSFVDSLVPSSRQRRVVEGIVSMARDIGLQVVAEGVETEAERDLLGEMGCPYGQGYLYSPPLRSTEVIGWLTRPAAPSIPAQPTAPAVEEHENDVSS